MKRHLLAAVALLLGASAARAETVVVTADRMIDVLAGRAVDRPQVVITDGRIAAVGRQGDAAPQGAKRIELPGKTLLPGLIDMHVHLGGSEKVKGYRTLEFTDNFFLVMGVPNAGKLLDAGFTTVRSVGAGGYLDVALRQGIELGELRGPRIIAATSPIGATGGHCDENTNQPSRARTAPGVADGPDEVRKKVRELRKLGAQVIKVCATGGVFSRNTDPGAQQMTYEELKMAADEAHMLGMKVAAHAHGTDGIKAAIRAGIDTIEHASFLDDEAIRMAKERGTWLSMDIYNTDYTLTEGAKNGVLEENLAKERIVGTRQREAFRRSVQLGARHVFGSDVGVYPAGLGGRQFPVMVRFGMTPMQAIQAATSNAAQALGREKDVGAIAVGRFGDMIAVDGDPIADIRQLEDVDVVIKGGKIEKSER
ncbi:MAG TPA: amidohydrolase family protein [Allosphingosinicella sp.]|jgi:imidazolonepropionase-like amidohydrolase|uniref:Xaa-Pro dipeptidase n=1 Tax=Allosphingosinicella sp. TaxID=2823234 RepID=UPI002F289DD5